ncbi:peptidase dimerization domain-containing protein [Peribacillus frigoritolerans]|nr:peptidase dimerization domain-containing protein [Peribacillus frigoritolerans]
MVIGGGDFVICAEPTQLGIGLQAKGALRLDIEVSGKSAHGSRPWEGVNAIEKAYDLYQKNKGTSFHPGSYSPLLFPLT